MDPTVPTVPGGGRLGHVGELRRDRLGLFLRAAALGDVAEIRALHRRILVVNEPGLLHELLVERARCFEHTRSMRLLLEPLMGQGLFTAEGEPWRRHRRLMAPLFAPAQVAGYADAMTQCARSVAAGWRPGAELDLAAALTTITMAVVGRALFSADTFDAGDAIGEALSAALEWSGTQANSPFMVGQMIAQGLVRAAHERLPAPLRAGTRAALDRLSRPILPPGRETRRFRAAIAAVDAYIARMIAARRDADAPDDLLARLVRARDERGSMSERQLRDEVVTLFVAGHETTAAALAFTFDLLAEHPDVLAALRAEVDALPGPPGAADLPRLGLCLRAFKEALRLYPPIYAFPRECVEATTLGPYTCPRGQTIYVSPFALHRRPDLWPDPERFDPARFEPAAEQARPRLAWLPFGAGPRVCIGQHFALMEGPLILAALLREWEFTPLRPPGRRSLQAHSTLRLAGGLPVRVAPRRQ